MRDGLPIVEYRIPADCHEITISVTFLTRYRKTAVATRRVVTGHKHHRMVDAGVLPRHPRRLPSPRNSRYRLPP